MVGEIPAGPELPPFPRKSPSHFPQAPPFSFLGGCLRSRENSRFLRARRGQHPAVISKVSSRLRAAIAIVVEAFSGPAAARWPRPSGVRASFAFHSARGCGERSAFASGRRRAPGRGALRPRPPRRLRRGARRGLWAGGGLGQRGEPSAAASAPPGLGREFSRERADVLVGFGGGGGGSGGAVTRVGPPAVKMAAEPAVCSGRTRD